jgi:predicted MFS family arabinose efflux permease
VTNEQAARRAALWGILLPAAAIMVLTMGTRQVTGLFLSPINTATGIGVVGISFAMAVGQFVWGASQPVFGALADRWGPVWVMIAGGLMLALGFALTPFMKSEWGLVFTLGLLMSAGAGAGSFSILIGAASQRLPAEQRSWASGFINAGGSFGQFLFAPLTERAIALAGWINAMYMLAVAALLTLPLALRLRTKPKGSPGAAPAVEAGTLVQGSLRQQIRVAMRDRSYLCLHAGFFTCGFHISFLLTHLPGEVALCNLPTAVSGVSIAIIGLANIVGSLGVGALGGHFRMKYLLFWMYFSRTLIILAYLASPKTEFGFYVFAAGLGLTWLATVPPTAGLVGKLFGVRYLATLFGLTLLTHQVGGFLGAWLGGIAIDRTGGYHLMWIADATLATIAALFNLPIREQKLAPRAA